MELNDNGAEREEVEGCSSAGGQQERSKEESSSLSPPSQTPQTPQSPPSGALLFTNMQLPASLTQPLTSPKPADTGSELPSPSVADPVKPAANSCLVLSPPTASSNTQPSSETAPTSLPPTPASQGEQQQQQQVCYTSQPILPQASPAAPVTLIPPPRPTGLAPGTLAPASLTTLVLPTSTPRPLLVLPSPAPTLLVSSPRLMRLPLLLPTQTLQLLPPASMDTQGKKSVLLTTIKAPTGRVTPPMRLGAPRAPLPSLSNPRAPVPLPVVSNSKVGQAAAASQSNSRSSRGGQPTGVIKFSNPALGGQPIKVDLSSVVTSGQRRAPSPLGPARKLDLDDEEKGSRQGDHVKVEEVKSEVEVKKEDEDEEVSLQCTEQIVDSPSPGKKSEGRLKEEQSRKQTPLQAMPSLLEPLPGAGDQGSTLPTATNEFGLIQLGPIGRKEGTSSVLASPRKDQRIQRIQDDEILCCEGCGCYGMAGEFTSSNSCSPACSRVILARAREEARKAKELEAVAARREERRAGTPQGKKKKVSEDVKEMVAARPGHYNSSYPWHCSRKAFLWQAYLEWASAKAAPDRLFPHPLEGHHFQLGMKLEAIDPEHQALICVVSVVEVVGHRLRLHFDGYGDSHDFWENADSENLFPAGWCSQHEQCLVPPKGYSPQSFRWANYLTITSSLAAPEPLFLGRAKATGNAVVQGWKVGDKLEALDLHDTEHDLAYVATVSIVMEGRVLIHFDGWSINHDYWARPDGPYLHPVGWAAGSKRKLIPPQDSQDTPSSFTWAAYLASQGAKPVPAWAFTSSSKDQTEFRTGQRLEAVDFHNPSLVRVASIAGVAGRRVKVHYDGWPEEYQVWMDDSSPDLHPPGWAERTGHPLQEPLTPEEVKYWASRGGCPTPGCRGLGHIRGAKYNSHHSLAACPYSTRNLDGEDPLPDRLQGAERDRIEERLARVERKASEPTSRGNAAQHEEVMGRGNRTRRKRKFFDDPEKKGKGRRAQHTTEEKRQRNTGSTNGLNGGDESPQEGNANSVPQTDEEAETSTEKADKEDTDHNLGTSLQPDKDVKEEEEEEETMADFSAEWNDRVRKSVFRPGYLPQPAPPGCMPFLWQEHARLLLGPTAEATTAAKAKLWKFEEVGKFISEIPNIDHRVVADRLREEEIDGEALLSLTQNDLTAILEIKLGPAIKIFNAITAVRLRRS